MKHKEIQTEIVKLADNLQGYYARPQAGDIYPAVIVFMEGFGLNEFIKFDVCDRLAQSGFAALAPDFYHGDVYQYTDMQAGISKIKTLDEDIIMAETGSGLEFLANRQEVDVNRVGAIGFCMGGRLAFLANSVYAHQLKGTVCFYGGGIAPEKDPFGRPSLLDRVEAMQAPLLLVYGALDNIITPDEHERITKSLSVAKKRYTLSVFPDAGHGFASVRKEGSEAVAAKEAWQMTMNFFFQNLAF
ncbi:dienelactone hydrolase family protein [Nostoc sp. FACHB-133]|uniref:dienelactone hydrolase family protein n=1 Tax=Nostoc sp. FACHB-133 TaxID=2692835 RepID=UPI0016822D9C|nr:dienelactone hydrolase family protein [Nostoc sp. FACHB-133]MBD2527695.1 dienelactone hydrolase family protein [Nostoc sp. FACHB-133]